MKIIRRLLAALSAAGLLCSILVLVMSEACNLTSALIAPMLVAIILFSLLLWLATEVDGENSSNPLPPEEKEENEHESNS